jgi:Protein of unknown function (DUF2917)
MHSRSAFIKEVQMQLQAKAPVLFLGHGEVLALDDAKGVRIGTRTGTVWVTQEGRLQDDIIASGDTIIVANGGRTLVQALKPAWITIHPIDAANDAQ